MHTGWMGPPRAPHSLVSAAVGRRSVAAGAEPGGGGGADVVGVFKALVDGAGGDGAGGDGAGGDGAGGDGAGGDGAGVGAVCRMALPSMGATGFGPEVHPTRIRTATEPKPRIERIISDVGQRARRTSTKFSRLHR